MYTFIMMNIVRKQKTYIYLLLLSIFIVSVIIVFKLALFPGALAQPCVAIEIPLVNLGSVESGRGEKTVSFKIKNTGNATLQLIKLKVSCSCLKAHIGDSYLGPGEETVIQASFHPPASIGEWTEHFLLETNDPKNRYTKLAVKAYLEYRCEVFPRSITVNQLKRNESRKYEITVLGPSSDLSFEILDVISKNENICIIDYFAVGTVIKRNRKKWRIDVLIKSCGKDSWRDQLTIKTSDNINPYINIPAKVQEKMSIQIIPRLLILNQGNDKSESVGGTFTITSSSDTPLKYTRSKTPEWISIHEHMQNKFIPHTLTFEVKPTKLLEKGIHKGQIYIYLEGRIDPVIVNIMLLSQNESL